MTRTKRIPAVVWVALLMVAGMVSALVGVYLMAGVEGLLAAVGGYVAIIALKLDVDD